MYITIFLSILTIAYIMNCIINHLLCKEIAKLENKINNLLSLIQDKQDG